MVQLILISGTVTALTVGVTLLVLVLLRTIRSSASLTGLSKIGPLNVERETASESHWVLPEPVIRGYDTPELYQEDSLARSGGVTTDKQLR